MIDGRFTMPLPRPPSKAQSLGIVIAFFMATLLTYGASVGNRFVTWDDILLIAENPIVQTFSPSTVGKAFTSYDPELYVPLTFVSYQINHLIAGNEPLIYHLTDLFLHTFNAVFVAWILWLLIGNGWLALGLGMIFALHPLNTEAVVWASARKDVLSTFFFLGSVLTYLYASESGNKKMYAASVLLFLLSLLSKVMTVTGPVVLLLIDIFRGRPINARTLRDKIPYVLLSIVFGIVGLFGKTKILVSSTLLQKISMAAKSTVFYLQKFLWPSDLSVVYPYTKPITLSSPDFFAPLVIVILLLAAAAYFWNRMRAVSVSILFVLVTLLPTFINFAKGGDLYFASDRYFYLPMIGLLLLIGIFLRRWIDAASTMREMEFRPKVLMAVFAVLFIACGWASSRQSFVWRDSITLFEHAIALYPDSRAAQNNLGMERLMAEETDEAIELFRAAIAIHDDPRTRVNLGAALVQKGNLEEALAMYLSVIAMDPRIPDVYYGIGNVYRKQGKFAEAVTQYRKAIDVDPEYLNAYNNLGATYLQMEDWPHAIEILKKTTELRPDFTESYYNLGVAYEQTGDTANAEIQYRKTIALNPGDADALAILATIVYSRGDIDEAAAYLQRALAIDPSNPAASALLLRMKNDGIVR